MRERVDKILENLERLIDEHKIDEDTKEEIRSAVNEIEELFGDFEYKIDELKDELEMYVDNMNCSGIDISYRDFL